MDSDLVLDVAGVLQDCAEEMEEAVQLLADRSNPAGLLRAFSLLRNSSVQMRSIVSSLAMEDTGLPQ